MKKVRRLCVGLLVVVLGAVALPATADAGWTRTISSIEIRNDDLSLCDNALRFEAFYRANPGALPGDFDYTLGEPYPYNGGADTLRLYTSAANAINSGPTLATVTIPMELTFIDPADTWHEFLGEASIVPPAGIGSGSAIYVQQNFDPGSNTYEALELTVGDAKYNCPPPPVEFDVEWLWGGPAVRVRSGLPGILYFDATGINVRSFKIMADNGKIAPVRHLVTINDTAFVFFKPRRAGVKCSSDSFIIKGFTSDGQPVSDVLPITPFPCPWPG